MLNEVDVIEPIAPIEKLPVARALWTPKPDLETSAAAWITAGGSHHPVFSQALATDHFVDFCNMLDVELAVIDADTRLRDFQQQLRTAAAPGVYPPSR